MSIFQQASRSKLRFATQLGNLSTEDLWDLPLTSVKGVSLKSIATDLQKQITAQPMKELDFFELSEATDNTLTKETRSRDSRTISIIYTT